ncbi:MAG: asparagine synthase (glutamine-hydrolyzing), partial [Lachnospiraceae bacterium]
MCGIAGFCGKKKDAIAEISKMCDQIIHRGPNAFGYYSDDTCDITLGHRRLSILDLSSNGTQPMTSNSGRFVICFNGEIYNHQFLKEKLLKDGYVKHFKSTTDTEILLEGIEAYGFSILKELSGMFAVALFDKKQQELHLFRDRVGEKPLYYGMVDHQFVFASDLASLKVMTGFTNNLSKEALSLYFRYKSIPQPFSIYEHIYKLIPGQILSIKAPFTTPTFSSYFSLEECAIKGIQSPFAGSFSEAKEELRRLLRTSISNQMIADVPIGAFLSGGIDSPLVVSIMQELSSTAIHSFTIGFDDTSCNEAVYAKDIAKHLGTTHTELYVSNNDLKEVIPLLPKMFSEPLADPAALPNYLVSKLASNSVVVTLSGDGGDELFCGYELYQKLNTLYPKIHSIPSSFRSFSSHCIKKTPLSNHRKLYNLSEYLEVNKIGDLHELHRNEHSKIAHTLVPHCDYKTDIRSFAILKEDAYLLPPLSSFSTTFADSIATMLYKDQLGFMTDTVLNKVDRTGMAVSLENRIPLMDKDILEFSWSLPTEFKSHNGINKRILKELLYDYVPKTMLDRPKHGFEVP